MIWNNVYLRFLLLAFAAVLLVLLLLVTQLAWRSFLIALLVAYLVNPGLEWLQRRRIPRGVGVALFMILLIAFFLIATLLLSSILVNLAQIPAALGSALARLPEWLNSDRPPQWFQTLLIENQQDLITFWDNAQRDVLGWLETNARSLATDLLRGTQGLVTQGFNLFILFVFIAFTVSGFPLIRQSLFDLFPVRRQPLAKDLAAKLDVAVGGYLRAKLLESGIMFVVSSTVLTLLGVPNALALGVINALLNPLPYVGPVVATIIEALVALTVSWQLALVTGLVMFTIEQLDGNIVGPMLLSKGVDVHPVAILSAVIVGGAVFGFWGVLLAIPVTAFLQLVYRDYYRTSQWYRRRAEGEEVVKRG